MKRHMLIGLVGAGCIALMMTPPLLSLVQPPGEHPSDHPKKDHPAKEHPAGEHPAAGQPDMEAWLAQNQPGEHHKHLEKFVGTFTTRQKFWMAPDTEPEEYTGKAVNRMILGGRYLESEYTAEVFGAPFTGRGLTGYDNMAGKYVSIWIDTMSTGITFGEGQCANEGNQLNLAGEMDMGQMGKMKYRESFTIIDENSYKFEWFDFAAGEEHKSMEIIYTRVK